MEKKGKNVMSEKDMGDYILQRRRVDRKGMIEPIEYDLKIPKTVEAWEKLYSKGDLLDKGVASLKTENDDAIEQSGSPMTEEKMVKKNLKGASSDALKAIEKILAEDAAKRGIAAPNKVEVEARMEGMKKEMKKAGFGK